MLNIRIKEAREHYEYSQEYVAEKVGVKQQTLAKIESGKTAMPRCLPKIALVLKVSIEWLITGNPLYAPEWLKPDFIKDKLIRPATTEELRGKALAIFDALADFQRDEWISQGEKMAAEADRFRKALTPEFKGFNDD